MSTPEDKLDLAIAALKRIADFSHTPGCNSSAPVYECGCYDKSQWEIAEDALKALGER